MKLFAKVRPVGSPEGTKWSTRAVIASTNELARRQLQDLNLEILGNAIRKNTTSLPSEMGGKRKKTEATTKKNKP